jgi:predicted permease
MSWFSKLRNTLNSGRLDRDLGDEFRDHVQRRAADLISQGCPPEQALRRATALFGNPILLRETAREFRLSSALEGFLQDLRYAWRVLLRTPAFAVTAVASLSLAIGVNTAIYSIIDAAILRPLPVPSPDRLFVLSASGAKRPDIPNQTERNAFSYPLFLQIREAVEGQASAAFFSRPSRAEMQLGDQNAAIELATQQYVSGRAFAMLSVPPAAGRLFSEEEDRGVGAHSTIVISHEYWKRKFGSDPAAIGRIIRVDSRPFRIIGVAGEGYSGIEPGKFVDIWIPATMFDPGALTNPDLNWGYIIGRLAPAAQSNRLQARVRLAEPDLQVRSGGRGVSAFRDSFGRPLWIVLGVAAGILLIACSNVASLLLARAAARASELSLRVSLGASRLRLARQMWTESLLLSALATAAGGIIARWTVPFVTRFLAPAGTALQLKTNTDIRVLGFCAAICVVCALFFGLIPAWQAAVIRPGFAVRQSDGQARGLRLGRVFVGVQIAFAFCLVVAGAGFLFSLHNLFTVDTGFDPRGVTVTSLTVERGGPHLPELRQFQHRLEAVPKIQSAAYAWMPIFSGSPRAQRVGLPGGPLSTRSETFYRVSPGYLAAMKTPLLAGRDLIPNDTDGTEPVPSVVNRAFARRYFGTESILGRDFIRDDGVRHRIVGLAANAYYGDLRSGAEPIIYFPMRPPRWFTLYVRSSLGTPTVMRLIEREVAALGPGIHVVETSSLETLVGNSVLREKLLAGIGGVFAFLGLVLAAIGLFGLLNYTVTRRTREIGIRSALGAHRATLVRMVLREVAATLAGGLTAGVIGAVFFLNVSKSLLFGISPADPKVIATAALIFAAAAITASALPARRAAAIDPMTALRHE